MKISTKIILIVVAVGLIGLGMSLYSAFGMQQIDREYSELVDVKGRALVQRVRANRMILGVAHASYKTMAYDGNSQTAQSASADRGDFMKQANDYLNDARSVLPEEGANIDSELALLRVIDAKTSEAVAAGLRNENEVARSILAEADGSVDELSKMMSANNDRMIAANAAKAASLSADIGQMLLSTITASVLAVLFGVAAAVVISSKGVTGPLNRLGQRMSELATGQLDVVIDGQDRRDEIGHMAKTVQVFKDAAHENKRLEAEAATTRLAQQSQRDRQSAIDVSKAEDLRIFVHAVEAGFDGLSSGDLTVRMNSAVAPEFEPIRAKFNDSVAILEDAIGSVVAAVGTIRVGLGQIGVAAGDLSQRTEQQAASLEETVAALAEVTRGINGTASEAAQAQSVATIALRNAERGGGIVGKAVEAMSHIEASSDRIGKIIGVIDEIAFQTNLLALNAGVEAARAGEAGRGFAVVASEVRGLAQRSAEAAKEIKELISASSTQVAHGVELVTASGRSLGEIVEQVGEMSRVVAVIAGSAMEQAMSLKEISTAADQMDKVTQQNAAMVEETTAAAQSLSVETDDLAGMVGRFRTNVGTPLREGRHPAVGARPASTSPRSASSANRAVPQMRTTGAGGAARMPATESWDEF